MLHGHRECVLLTGGIDSGRAGEIDATGTDVGNFIGVVACGAVAQIAGGVGVTCVGAGDLGVGDRG